MVNKLFMFNGEEISFCFHAADSVVEQIERVFIKNKPSLIIIDGGLGEGKTTLAVHFADFINKQKGFPPIDISLDCSQYAFGGKQFVKKIIECHEKGLPVIIYDEGGDFSSRGSLSRANRELNRIFETYRALKVMVIICLPYFNDLDSGIFKKKLARGLFHLQGRTAERGYYKAYGAWELTYARSVIKKYCNPEAGYMYTTPCFRGLFKNLSAERCAALSELGLKLKKGEAGKVILRQEGYVSTTELSERFGITVKYLSEKLRKWKIKPIMRVKKNNFYHESMAEMIEGRLRAKL